MVIKKGAFITFEGTDGAGKSTHIRLLAAWLRARGYSVTLTREPGGGPVSEAIRQVLLNRHMRMSPMTELLLYFAARAEHVEKIIRPALKKKAVVLCDRYTDATVAYQGFGRGLDRQVIGHLHRIATGSLQPDLTLWLDVPVATGLRRAARAKAGQADRIEAEGARFMARVRNGYRFLQRTQPRRVARIPLQPEKKDTQTLIRRAVEKLGL